MKESVTVVHGRYYIDLSMGGFYILILKKNYIYVKNNNKNIAV